MEHFDASGSNGRDDVSAVDGVTIIGRMSDFDDAIQREQRLRESVARKKEFWDKYQFNPWERKDGHPRVALEDDCVMPVYDVAQSPIDGLGELLASALPRLTATDEFHIITHGTDTFAAKRPPLTKRSTPSTGYRGRTSRAAVRSNNKVISARDRDFPIVKGIDLRDPRKRDSNFKYSFFALGDGRFATEPDYGRGRAQDMDVLVGVIRARLAALVLDRQ